jgi:hypothetical protein
MERFKSTAVALQAGVFSVDTEAAPANGCLADILLPGADGWG